MYLEALQLYSCTTQLVLTQIIARLTLGTLFGVTVVGEEREGEEEGGRVRTVA